MLSSMKVLILSKSLNFILSFLKKSLIIHFQVEQHPNATTMMNVAKNLRLERDKEKKLAEQRQEQVTLVGSALDE